MKKKANKKASKSKKSSKQSEKNIQSIGQYLVAKNGKTKYIKLGTHDKAPKEVRALIKKLIELLGTDILYMNLFDADFKESKGIPDFVKGSVRVDMDAEDAESSDDEDDEDSSDDEDESEDEDEDDESDDDEDSDDEDDEDDF